MNKIILTILTLFPLVGFAQADWENPKGAIKDEEIVIEKNKQITLQPISRRFTSITIETIPTDSSVIQYTPKEIGLEIAKIPVKLRPKTMMAEPLNKTYWGTFKAGYGSYVSPYLQADLASKRSDEYAIALHFRHFSSKNGPIDEANSGLSNTDGFLSGKLFLNRITIGATAGSKFDKYHLYGYDATIPIPETQTITQRLSNYSLGVSLTDNDKNDSFFYTLNGGADFFKAKDLVWTETDLFANLKSNISISENLKLNFLGEFHWSQTDALLVPNNRLYYMAKPIGVYTYDAFVLEVGAGLYGTKDSINSYQHKFYITPHLVARYLKSGHTLSVGVKGDVIWKSARIQFDENSYFGFSTLINNEVKPLDIFMEANGKIIPKVDYVIGYHAAIYSQFGQFINNYNDPSVFTIDYSTANNIIHQFSANINFITNKQLNFILYGKYFGYKFEDFQNVYHLPKVDLGFASKFILEDKLVVQLTFTYLDGLYGFQPDLVENIDVKLNPILDLNFLANYRINSTISIFAKMNNILGNEYQYYYRYPSKGFQALGGVSVTL